MFAKLREKSEKAAHNSISVLTNPAAAAGAARERLQDARHKTVEKLQDAKSLALRAAGSPRAGAGTPIRRSCTDSSRTDAEPTAPSQDPAKARIAAMAAEASNASRKRQSRSDKTRERTQAALASLDPGFYDEDFDATRHTLEQLPSQLSDDNLRDEADRLYEVGDILQQGLSKHVLDHYSEFVGGMNQVRALSYAPPRFHFITSFASWMTATQGLLSPERKTLKPNFENRTTRFQNPTVSIRTSMRTGAKGCRSLYPACRLPRSCETSRCPTSLRRTGADT